MPLSAPFLRYGDILIENHRFKPNPPLFGALLGVTPLEFGLDLWHQKTRLAGLSYGAVCVIVGLAVLVEHRLVTNRQKKTDGRTDT